MRNLYKKTRESVGRLALVGLAALSLTGCADRKSIETATSPYSTGCETYQGYHRGNCANCTKEHVNNYHKNPDETLGVFDEKQAQWVWNGKGRKGDPNYEFLISREQRENLERDKSYRLKIIKRPDNRLSLLSAEACKSQKGK